MKRRLCTLILSFLGLIAASPAHGGRSGLYSLSDTVSPTTWSLLMGAKTTGLHDSLSRFGVRPDATDDYDSQYEIPRPPQPPGTSIQVYFPHEGGNWPGILGTKFAIDYTDPVNPHWTFIVEHNATPGQVTLEWDTSVINQLPDSYQILMVDSTIDSLIYLRGSDSYIFSYTAPRVFSIRVEYTSTFIGINAGWNIISVPRIVADYTRAALFPSGISSAFEYDGGYINRDTLANAKGYWVKFPAADIVYQSGLGIDTLDIPVSEGWNLIGTLSETVPVPFSPVTSSLFYRYAGGYHAADSLVPGWGYWIKVISDGILSVGTSGGVTVPAATPAGTRIDHSPSPSGLQCFPAADTFTITNTAGERTALYGLRESAMENPDRFAMPPVPPDGAFDARFSTGRIAAATMPSAGPGREFTIIVQSPTEQVDFSVGPVTGDYRYEIQSGPGQWKAISGKSEPVAITHDPGRAFIRIRTAPTGAVPAGFILEQNYPNPFNPSTEFRYTLPEDALTEMNVTDLMGRIILRTAGEVANTGPHRFVFDAGAAGIASGIYFFRLRATGIQSALRYQDTKKMIYLK